MINSSAPGKILWLGGYSVLEKGNAAYVSTVDTRVRVELEPAQETRIKLPQFGVNDLENPKAIFAKEAIQTSMQYLKHKKIKTKNFALNSVSDAAFMVGAAKSGLGSSAAATTAIVSAVLVYHSVTDKTAIHHVAQVAHSRAQGKVGSGFDVTAACFGSCEYKRFSPQLVERFPAEGAWDYFVRPLPLPEFFHVVFAAFPRESASTVGMVKKVNEWKKEHVSEYAQLINDLNEADVNAIAYLEELEEGKNKENLALFKKYFEQGRALTRELGEKSCVPIEPKDVHDLIEASLQNGAFVCKSPGAGGKDALAALCLDEKSVRQLKNFWEYEGLRVLDVKTDNNGVLVSS